MSEGNSLGDVPLPISVPPTHVNTQRKQAFRAVEDSETWREITFQILKPSPG